MLETHQRLASCPNGLKSQASNPGRRRRATHGAAVTPRRKRKPPLARFLPFLHRPVRSTQWERPDSSRRAGSTRTINNKTPGCFVKPSWRTRLTLVALYNSKAIRDQSQMMSWHDVKHFDSSH